MVMDGGRIRKGGVRILDQDWGRAVETDGNSEWGMFFGTKTERFSCGVDFGGTILSKATYNGTPLWENADDFSSLNMGSVVQ
jgi:hypothetical protein